MSKENVQHYTSSQVRSGGVYGTYSFTNGDLICVDNAQIAMPSGSLPISDVNKIKGVVSPNLLMPDPVNRKLFTINASNQYRWLPVNFSNFNIINTSFTNTEHGMLYYFPSRVRVSGFWFYRPTAGNVQWSTRIYDFDIENKITTSIIYTGPVTSLAGAPNLYENIVTPFAADLEPGFYVFSIIFYTTATNMGLSNITATTRDDTFGFYSNVSPNVSILKFVRAHTGTPPLAPLTQTHYNTAQNPLMFGPLIIIP